jgi:vancomycin permeability regulator SanA
LEDARYHHATVVFGAGVYQSGEISGVFMDRLKTAARLFHSGKTDLIIVSTSLDQPNEQELILSTLRSLEVPDGMIIIDSKGSRTLETCKNVFQEYNLSDINVVSQAYHLPRIIFTCRHTGVISIDGIIADNNSYSIQNQIIWYLREKIATMIAFVELINFHESNSS